MQRILCIWLPNWPIQRLVAVRPELNGRPVVLHARDARRGQCVAACSAAARTHGARVGMPLAEATALLERSRVEGGGSRAGFHIETHDPQADREALLQLAEWCERFSPIVGLESAEQPASLFLDVTGLGPLFGGEAALAETVAAEFQQRGYVVRVTIADTIGAAWAVARFGITNYELRITKGEGEGEGEEKDVVSSDGSCCVLSTQYSVPFPLAVVPPDQNLIALAPLPVEALRLPDNTVDLLHQLGVFQIEQLLRLPRASLLSRFGDELLQRVDQASGAVKELIVAHRPPPEFQAQWLLEHPTDRRETVEYIVEQLVERVAAMLAQHNRGAVQIECRLDCTLECGDSSPLSLSTDDDRSEPASIQKEKTKAATSRRTPKSLHIHVGLFRPTAAPRHLMELVRMQLERLALPGPVGRVGVQAVMTAALENRQGQLFADHARQAAEQLALLVDRVSNRLGRECVVQPRLQADAQPERACRYLSLTGRRNAAKKNGQRRSSSHAPPAPLQRPLQLLSPPVSLEVVSVVPDGPPVRFQYQHRQHHVARHWGPERIETGWWRGRSVRRDYYRVETETGIRFWLFRQLEDGRWFLHGEFA
jgi:protein ImuB